MAESEETAQAAAHDGSSLYSSAFYLSCVLTAAIVLYGRKKNAEDSNEMPSEAFKRFQMLYLGVRSRRQNARQFTVHIARGHSEGSCAVCHPRHHCRGHLPLPPLRSQQPTRWNLFSLLSPRLSSSTGLLPHGGRRLAAGSVRVRSVRLTSIGPSSGTSSFKDSTSLRVDSRSSL